MKRLHQQVGGDAQASEGKRLWDCVQKSLYSNRGGGQQFFDRLYAQLHNLARYHNEPSRAVESEKFLDTHLREACRKLEIAFPVPPANEDKQQRSRRSVLAHSALYDEGLTSSLSTDSFSTPTRRQAMVSVTPSFVDEVFENDAQVMFKHASPGVYLLSCDVHPSQCQSICREMGTSEHPATVGDIAIPDFVSTGNH
jgi:hypothetical protein